MSDILRWASDACPGDVPHARATVSTSERLLIPDDMRGKFCTFTAEGTDVWIRFGTSDTLAVSRTAVSTVSSEVLTADTTAAHVHIPSGTTMSFRLQAGWTRLAHISTATSGYFRFGLAQGAFGAD
jgi:hypothetical protein